MADDANIVAWQDRYYPAVFSLTSAVGVFTVLTAGEIGDCAAYRLCFDPEAHNPQSSPADAQMLSSHAARRGQKISKAEAQAFWPDLCGLQWRL